MFSCSAASEPISSGDMLITERDGDVVEGDRRLPRRLGDLCEVRAKALLGRLVVVGRDDEDAVCSGLRGAHA